MVTKIGYYIDFNRYTLALYLERQVIQLQELNVKRPLLLWPEMINKPSIPKFHQ